MISTTSARRTRILLGAGAVLLAAGALLLAAAPASAGTVTFTVDAPTLQSLLLAVTPYELVIGKKGLSETLTLSNPREVRFAGGKIRLKLDCRGTPLPIEEVLEPALTIQWSDVKKAFEARVENLPLKIPAFGSVDLAEYVRPISIPTTFTQSAGQGEEALALDGKLNSLKVLDTLIQVSADITFKKAAPAPPSLRAQTRASVREPSRP